MTKIKGQNLRISLGGKIVAAATSCSIHYAAQLEDSSTKDDTNDWSNQECTGKSWDGSADALVVIDASETGLKAFDTLALLGTKVSVSFEHTSGEKNRVVSGVIYSGEAIINDVSISAGNRQNATYSIQFTGVGELTSEE